VEVLREELEKMIGRKVTINVVEIKDPDLNAMLVAEAIAEQLTKRASYRRVMKQYCETAINSGAKGIKIMCGGRLAGSEIARRETQKLGSIPLHTLDANVDYATATAHTTYGTIGVKVWIYKGKFGEEVEATRPTMPRRRTRRPFGRPAESTAPQNNVEPSNKISGKKPSVENTSENMPGNTASTDNKE